jgi:hypothetical protein
MFLPPSFFRNFGPLLNPNQSDMFLSLPGDVGGEVRTSSAWMGYRKFPGCFLDNARVRALVILSDIAWIFPKPLHENFIQATKVVTTNHARMKKKMGLGFKVLYFYQFISEES